MLNNLFSLFTKPGESENDIKPSAAPINGKIHYTFLSGLKAYQEELNLDQDTRLTELLLGFDVSSFITVDTSVKDIILMLIKENLLSKVLDIILIPAADSPAYLAGDYGKLKNSELLIIFRDFFSLNPTAINWLKTIGSGLTSLLPTLSIKNS